MKSVSAKQLSDFLEFKYSVERRGHRAAEPWLASLPSVCGFDHATSSVAARTPQRTSGSRPVAYQEV